ncbi:zinc finger protein 367-like [Diadema setosum]|uniref:zinc finger protein 367-like n=1 Tax=Diadema setosum TaxID=31175 RepID=UPI003B3A0681
MAGILTNSPQKIMPNTIIQSPVRPIQLKPTPLSPMSPGFGDFYPWKWSDSARDIELSPSSSCGGSPGVDRGMCRGRPRAEMIAELRKAGSESDGAIRCRICSRIFPREKSLQAHLRTHTGERPYKCDYPNCGRAFVQSGQLKTHQRLHTGEKPFACSVPGCQTRFTHANRHCAEHPYASLRRETTQVSVNEVTRSDENSEEVASWLQKYADSQQKPRGGAGSTSTTPTSSRGSRKRLRAMSGSTSPGEEEGGSGETPKRRRPSVRRLLEEQQEKMMGAIALIELAQNSMALPPVPKDS